MFLILRKFCPLGPNYGLPEHHIAAVRTLIAVCITITVCIVVILDTFRCVVTIIGVAELGFRGMTQTQIVAYLVQRGLCRGAYYIDGGTLLDGAGPTYAPRLLVAFGEQRDRYANAAEAQKYSGIANVPACEGGRQ